MSKPQPPLEMTEQAVREALSLGRIIVMSDPWMRVYTYPDGRLYVCNARTGINLEWNAEDAQYCHTITYREFIQAERGDWNYPPKPRPEALHVPEFVPPSPLEETPAELGVDPRLALLLPFLTFAVGFLSGVIYYASK